LKDGSVADVYVVGLAYDFCVNATAVDAANEGFQTWVISEGTKAVDQSDWEQVIKDLEAKGVEVISFDSEQVKEVGK
jgi:nicotinamidase-related amidase